MGFFVCLSKNIGIAAQTLFSLTHTPLPGPQRIRHPPRLLYFVDTTYR